ncbi:MAG: 2OG-Fe(II) oxygenase, partial [Flavobacteriales bacterium]
MNRAEIGHIIYMQLLENKEVLKQQFLNSKKDIGYFYIDNLLPIDLALEIFEKFPSTEETVKR